MLRTTSRTLATLLGVALVLALATPVSAQKEKRTQRSRPSATKAVSSAKLKRASPTRSRSARTTATSLKSQSAAKTNRVRNTVRVNRAADPKTRSGRVATAFRSRATIGELKGTPRPRNRDADRERYQDLFRRPPDDGRDRDADRERYQDLYRRPPDDGRDRDSDRRDRDYDRDGRRRDGDRRDYDRNDRRRYDRGYDRGYNRGFRDGRYYRYHNYYGRHRVYGYHYGGFGFYNGHWHFAIVIGSPVIVRHRYNYYRYSWWDGYGTSLYTWDRAAQMYPASYNFDMSGRSCIALWIRTTDAADYEIKVDPRYYNARDPGDLYAALWTELERQGQLQIEDVNGAVHIFPAGMIQQIEARACY